MAAPLYDPYVADLERENKALIKALRDALDREALAASERDQLEARVRTLEADLAWNEYRFDYATQTLEQTIRAHRDAENRARELSNQLTDARTALTIAGGAA